MVYDTDDEKKYPSPAPVSDGSGVVEHVVPPEQYKQYDPERGRYVKRMRSFLRRTSGTETHEVEEWSFYDVEVDRDA